MTEVVQMPQSAYLDADVEVAGNLLVDGSITGGVSGQFLLAPAVVTSGTFTTTSATLSAISAGTVTTGTFTAPASGVVVVTADLVVNSSAAAATGWGLAATRTVTPIVGYVVGAEQSSSVPYTPYHLAFPVTGLTAGNTYGFDLLFAITNSATLSAVAAANTSTVITGSLKGAPIIMSVQAV
jgi:hypothetical protein